MILGWFSKKKTYRKDSWFSPYRWPPSFFFLILTFYFDHIYYCNKLRIIAHWYMVKKYCTRKKTSWFSPDSHRTYWIHSGDEEKPTTHVLGGRSSYINPRHTTDVEIAEVLAYNTQLTKRQREKVEAFLFFFDHLLVTSALLHRIQTGRWSKKNKKKRYLTKKWVIKNSRYCPQIFGHVSGIEVCDASVGRTLLPLQFF